MRFQGEVFRLETRAREFSFMASLRVQSPKAKGNRSSAASQDVREGVLIVLLSHEGKTRNRAILS